MPNKAKTHARDTDAPQILLKGDSITLTMTADKEGKIRLRSVSWDDALVLLPGQRLEARWQNGQVALVRREA